MKLYFELSIACEKCDKKVITIKDNNAYSIHEKFTLVCDPCALKLKQEKQKQNEKPKPKEGVQYIIMDESHGRHSCEYSENGVDCMTKATHWITELSTYSCQQHFDKWAKGWVPE